MKTSRGGCPDDTCPNMYIWYPVLVIPLVIGMLFVVYLRRLGIALDPLSRKQMDQKQLVFVNDGSN